MGEVYFENEPIVDDEGPAGPRNLVITHVQLASGEWVLVENLSPELRAEMDAMLNVKELPPMNREQRRAAKKNAH